MGSIVYIKLVATKRNRAGANQKTAVERIKAARRESGLSQEDVGRRLGLSRSGYGHLEDGSRLLTLDDLANLSRILGRPVEYFLGLDTGMTEDEGQLLAAYQSIDDDVAKRLVLAMVREAAVEYHT